MDKKEKQTLIENFLTRGVENIIPSREELEKLLWSGKVLNVYLGIDPTATKIHLGHAFPLRKLQILALLGHNVTFLIGDFTAKVGDTSDKETERPVLTDEQIEENFQTYKRQAEKLLDFSKVKIHHNSEWLSKLNFGDILKLSQNFSLNDFISRELIRKRLDEGKRVSLPETLYPIMQGYDSFILDTDIQLGGTDQTFNMQAGRTMIKNNNGKESFVVANGFLPGTDGRKMSKTWGNAIWIEDTPEEIYGKIMSIADDVLITYFVMGTNADKKVIEDAKMRLEKGENPMNLKKELANIIVRELHGKEAVQTAEEHFRKTVVEKVAGEDTPLVKVKSKVSILGTDNTLASFAISNGLVGSNTEFKTLLKEGAIYLNEKKAWRREGTSSSQRRKYCTLWEKKISKNCKMKETERLYQLTIGNNSLGEFAKVGWCRLWTVVVLDLIKDNGWTCEAREVEIVSGYTHTFLRVTLPEGEVYLVDGTGTVNSGVYFGLEEVAPEILKNNKPDIMIMSYVNLRSVDKR
jgi:tyrosyl-tRNA synthetase